jgi:DnaJ C terminal domain
VKIVHTTAATATVMHAVAAPLTCSTCIVTTVLLLYIQDPGIPGVLPGDLIFVITEDPADSAGFTRHGDHLVADIELTLSEALLGFARPLAHLDGTTLRVTGGARAAAAAAAAGFSTAAAAGSASTAGTAAVEQKQQKKRKGGKKDAKKDVGKDVGQTVEQKKFLPGFVVRPGDFKRLRAKGMPKRGVPGAYGDLYIRFSVAFPTEVSDYKL